MPYINATSCQINGNNFREVLCSDIIINNEGNPLKMKNLNNTSELFVLLSPEFELTLEMENWNNICIIYSSVPDCTKCLIKNEKGCSGSKCKLSQTDCLVHFKNFNKNSKFWIIIYGVLVIFTEFSRTVTFRFNDIISSGLAIESNADFGRQRLFGIVGSMVGPPLVGFILTNINEPNINEKSYSWVFFSSIIFSVLSAFFMGIVNPEFHKPASKMWRKSFALVENMDIMLFLVLLIVMGSVLGFQLTYRNWYLKELGASDQLTGIVSGSTGLYGIPFLYNSKWCLNKVGVRSMFVLGLLGHVVCSFSYSLMAAPWIAVILESTSIVSYHLFWVAAVEYSHLVAPEGLVALMKALTGSLHFNVGKLGSSLIAGFIMKIYGGSAAFTVLGCIALAYSFIYASYLFALHLRQKKTGTPSNIVIEKEDAG